MKKKVKRKSTKFVQKKRAVPPQRKKKKSVPKVRSSTKKRQANREKNLIKRLERAAKKEGVSLFTYVRRARFKKNKN